MILGIIYHLEQDAYVGLVGYTYIYWNFVVSRFSDD